MLLRLILVLMLALTTPAAHASAGDGATPTAMSGHAMPGMDHSGMDHKMPMAGQHFCVGCVPMNDWGATRVQPRILLPEPAPVARIAGLPLVPGEAPTPPPPRIA